MKVVIAAAALSLSAIAMPAAPGAAQGVLAPAGCLVRFSAVLDAKGAIAFNGQQGSVLSPVYALAAKDCPANAFGIEEYSAEWTASGMTTRAGLPGMEGKTPRHAIGKRMIAAFGTWMSGRAVSPPGDCPECRHDDRASGDALHHERYLKDVGATAYFVEKPGPGGTKQIVPANSKWTAVHGVCLDYTPTGITPVEILGRQNCKTWIR